MNRIKRYISIFLAALILTLAIPVGDFVSYAEEGTVTDPDPNIGPKVTSVIVTKMYEEIGGPVKYNIDIKGNGFRRKDDGELNLNIIIYSKEGENLEVGRVLKPEIITTTDLVYSDLENEPIKLSIAGDEISISSDLPELKEKTPVSGYVNASDGKFTLTGEGFSLLKNKGGKITGGTMRGKDITHFEIGKEKDVISDTKIESSKLKIGMNDVSFRETKKIESEKPVIKDAVVITEHKYLNVFRVYQELLDKGEPVTVHPTRGPLGIEVDLERKQLLPGDEMSVFLVKDLNESLTLNHMAEFVNFRIVDDESQIFRFKVPESLEDQYGVSNYTGDYHIVLTNYIDPENGNPEKGITKRTELDQKFTVVTSEVSMSLKSIDPDSGSVDGGSKSTIRGRYISRMANDVNDLRDVDEGEKYPEIRKGNNSIIAKYKNGIYKDAGINGIKYESLEREVKVQIGREGLFEGFKEGEDASDVINMVGDKDEELYVTIPEITLREGENPVKDVSVQVETKIKYYERDKNGDKIDPQNLKTIILREADVLENAFTYMPSEYTPNITGLHPSTIPVDKEGKVKPKGIILRIYGENFTLHKYRDEEGKIKFKYPVIDLAGDGVVGDGNITINKNLDDKIDMQILDSNGDKVTGEIDNNRGTQIVVKIPTDQSIDKENLDKDSNVTITNPKLNNKKIEEIEEEGTKKITNMGSPFTSSRYKIRFINVEGKELPSINKLIPNVVKTTGYEGAVIDGSNFYPGITVHIDGVEIQDVEVRDVSTLVFDLPPKPEGEYQLMLQNEEGPIAITTVEYVKSYTNLRFDDFNPKKGTAGTVVTVTGGEFLRPANTKIMDISTAAIAKRLIGTTVYLGDRDVNEYNLDKDGKIILKPFLMGDEDKLLRRDKENRIILGDYTHSLILTEESDDGESYFSIYQDLETGEFKLSDIVDEYTLRFDGNKLMAELRKVEYEVQIDNQGTGTQVNLKRDNKIEKTFKVKTPYKISGGKITGNRVKVISDSELSFEVTPKTRNGYYDVKLENPDTNNISKIGEEGFYYYKPEYNPEIEKIVPNEGSVAGGYTIEIHAKKSASGEFRGFKDGAEDRVSVTIGTETVPAEDIKVSSDGYSMTVVVPKYPGNLMTETEMDRRSVNVVVVNPDGGSDSVENGFTYVIPKSNPRLTDLFRREGGASGGEIVVIEGYEFRYFEPFDDDNHNAQWDNGEPYNDLNINDEFDNLGKKKVWVGDYNPGTEKYTNNPEKKDLDQLTDEEWERFVKPILPKIVFVINGERKEAKIIDFDVGRIEVKTPEGIDGPAEVYLVNNDNGVSNTLTYDYRVTNPSISVVTPDTASKKGGQEIQILGENFVKSNIKVIGEGGKPEEKQIQLVQFGNLEDKNISNQIYGLGDLDDSGFENSGRITNRNGEVYVNNLKVQYDAKDHRNKNLEFTIEEGTDSSKEIYKFKYDNWDEEDIYIPLNILRNTKTDEDGERPYYNTTEMVRISLENIEGARLTKRLRVDRGYSPETDLKSSGDITVMVPTYYTVGETNVTVINSDKQEAVSRFRYTNPLSDPRITRILRNEELPVEEGEFRLVKVPYTGGSRIKIEGTDFYSGARLEIGGEQVAQNLLEFYPEMANKAEYIIFTIDGVDESRVGENHRVSLVNPDGGSTITTDLRIRFTKPETTELSITAAVPNTGPTKGGTEVTIYGSDFRNELDGYSGKLKVFFEKGNRTVQIPESDIISVDLDKIVLRTPAFTAGGANIIVENPDGNSVRLLDGFTYTSNPRITSVVDPEDDKLVIENISVEGGERVKIKGSDFIEGATVIFNPELEAIGDDVRDENLPEGEIITINEKRYVLKSGVDGTDVEVVNGQNILVTTPEGKLGDKGVLVRNPDGGVSNVYNIEYGIPEVGAPFDVRAELVYDQFIRVNWAGVRNALEYEIYVSVDGKKFEYMDSTELTSFAYMDILPRTKYEFMVRAIGQYGTSKPLDESKSNIVRTGSTAGPEDLDGELGENTVVKRQGTTADISIGSRDFRSEGYTIDLTRGELAGVKDITIRMPAEIITSYSSGEIKVLGTDYSMSFNPSVFRNSAMESNRNNSNAGVVFKVSVYNGEIGNAGGKIVAGPRYKLEGETYVQKNKTPIGRLAGGIHLTMDSNNVLVQSRSLRNLGLSRHFSGNNSWINTRSVDRMAIYAMTGSRR